MHGYGGLIELVHHDAAGSLGAVVGDFINAAERTRADVDLSAFATSHGSVSRRAMRPDFRLEARRQFKVLDRDIGRGCDSKFASMGGQLRVSHLGRHALFPDWQGWRGLCMRLGNAECEQ